VAKTGEGRFTPDSTMNSKSSIFLYFIKKIKLDFPARSINTVGKN